MVGNFSNRMIRVRCGRRHKGHSWANFCKVFVVGLCNFAWLVSPVFAVETNAGNHPDPVHANRLAIAAHAVHLQAVYLPMDKSSRALTYRQIGLTQLAIAGSGYYMIESIRRIHFDEPDEQEIRPDLLGTEYNASWQTYILPNGNVQHVLSLTYPHLYVAIVPESTQGVAHGTSVQDFAKWIAFAQTLSLVRI